MSVEEIKEYEGALDEIKGKLGDLNRRTFRSNLMNLLKDYKVPLDGIEEHIPRLIGMRNEIVHNEIVHKGYLVRDMYDSETIYFLIALLRELIKRIFLSLLKYKGQYQSFLNAPEWIDFPPRGSD